MFPTPAHECKEYLLYRETGFRNHLNVSPRLSPSETARVLSHLGGRPSSNSTQLRSRSDLVPCREALELTAWLRNMRGGTAHQQIILQFCSASTFGWHGGQPILSCSLPKETALRSLTGSVEGPGGVDSIHQQWALHHLQCGVGGALGKGSCLQNSRVPFVAMRRRHCKIGAREVLECGRPNWTPGSPIFFLNSFLVCLARVAFFFAPWVGMSEGKDHVHRTRS